MDDSICCCCWECEETAADVAAGMREVCLCEDVDDDVDYEYQGRTFEEEVASVGGWR